MTRAYGKANVTGQKEGLSKNGFVCIPAFVERRSCLFRVPERWASYCTDREGSGAWRTRFLGCEKSRGDGFPRLLGQH